MPEHKFTAVEWWELRGRNAGPVANIAGIPGFDPLPLVGQQVEIDGKPYTVRGVEWDLVSSVGKPFALLVAAEIDPNKPGDLQAFRDACDEQAQRGVRIEMEEEQ